MKVKRSFLLSLDKAPDQGLVFFYGFVVPYSYFLPIICTAQFAGGYTMAHELNPNEIVDFRELVMTNTIQVDTMYRLLIEKGFFTEAEFLDKMKEVQTLFMKGKNQPITN